jgi:hypothetical protein
MEFLLFDLLVHERRTGGLGLEYLKQEGARWIRILRLYNSG